MKDFKKNYKKAFLDSIKNENELERIKSNLEFESNTPIDFKPNRNKRPLIIGALSLALVSILIATISIFFIFRNQSIPTYKGMEIVDYTQVVHMRDKDDDDDEDDDDEDDDEVEKEVDEDAPTIIIDDSISYYANKGETITIAIHIDNPKQYDIISFILDGYKYQSFMFKEGSNSSIIYVDLTCQNSSGVQTIFIDELKYIDGTETKLARYDGDQTIKVGVAYENRPEILIEKETVTEEKYSLEFSLKDLDELVKADTFYRAYLLENGKIIQKNALKKETRKIEYSNLKMNTEYKVYIYVGLDMLDSKGYSKLLILKQIFRTNSGLKDAIITNDYEQLTFAATPIRTDVIITGAKLYNDNELVKEINGNAISFTNINSDTNYRLEISYKYTLNGSEVSDTISYSANTKKYDEPSFEGLVLYSKEDKTVNLDLEFTDPFKLIEEYTIYVYADNELITTTTDLLAFIELNKDYNEIKVVVKAKLDFKDGKGIALREYSERG